MIIHQAIHGQAQGGAYDEGNGELTKRTLFSMPFTLTYSLGNNSFKLHQGGCGADYGGDYSNNYVSDYVSDCGNDYGNDWCLGAFMHYVAGLIQMRSPSGIYIQHPR